jgi:hypothetical protein
MPPLSPTATLCGLSGREGDAMNGIVTISIQILFVDGQPRMASTTLDTSGGVDDEFATQVYQNIDAFVQFIATSQVDARFAAILLQIMKTPGVIETLRLAMMAELLSAVVDALTDDSDEEEVSVPDEFKNFMDTLGNIGGSDDE